MSYTVNRPPKKEDNKPTGPLYDGDMMLWQYCIGILHLASSDKELADLAFLNQLAQTRFEHLTRREVNFKVHYRIEFVAVELDANVLVERREITLKKIPV